MQAGAVTRRGFPPTDACLRGMAALVLGLWPSLLAAQAPMGVEFRVNTYTTGAQGRPTLAGSAAGAFVVAWSPRWRWTPPATSWWCG
jgi:hypothetical protein